MTRQALLLSLLILAQPARAHAAPTAASTGQAGGLFSAVAAAMGAQSSSFAMDRGSATVPATYRHHLSRRRGAVKNAGAPHMADAVFSDDLPIDEPPARPFTNVSAQDLAAALSPR